MSDFFCSPQDYQDAWIVRSGESPVRSSFSTIEPDDGMPAVSASVPAASMLDLPIIVSGFVSPGTIVLVGGAPGGGKSLAMSGATLLAVRDTLVRQVAVEAPEAVMGAIEAQQRHRLAYLDGLLDVLMLGGGGFARAAADPVPILPVETVGPRRALAISGPIGGQS